MPSTTSIPMRRRPSPCLAAPLCRKDKLDDDLPWLLYLQGPGFGAPRPTADGGWIKRALQEFRVLLLDQRGTGHSTPSVLTPWRG